MVRVLDSAAVSLGSSPAHGHCVVLLGKTLQLNPDNSNLQGKFKKVQVIGGKISKKITWRESKKVRVSGRFELSGFNCTRTVPLCTQVC